MKKRVLLLGVLGFALGVAVSLALSLLFSRVDGAVRFCSDSLIRRMGGARAALLLQLLLCGLYGLGCMLGTLFYEIERWPLALATGAHYLLISALYLALARLLGWGLTPRLLLSIEGLMTLCFVLIWLIMYLRYKAVVRELNALMEKKNKNIK